MYNVTLFSHKFRPGNINREDSMSDMSAGSTSSKSATSAKLNEAKNAGYYPRVLSQASDVKIAKTIVHGSIGKEKVMNFVAKVGHFKFSGGRNDNKSNEKKPEKCRLTLFPYYNKELRSDDVTF